MFKNNRFRRELLKDASKQTPLLDDDNTEGYLDAMLAEPTYVQLIEEYRTLAIRYLTTHEELTTDDLQRLRPVPDGINRAFLGMVFRDERFYRRGIKKRSLAKGGTGFVYRWGLK